MSPCSSDRTALIGWGFSDFISLHSVWMHRRLLMNERSLSVPDFLRCTLVTCNEAECCLDENDASNSLALCLPLVWSLGLLLATLGPNCVFHLIPLPAVADKSLHITDKYVKQPDDVSLQIMSRQYSMGAVRRSSRVARVMAPT
eukprot:scaffold23698_cov44-Prasinocladus_malaysianus.AAC.3